MVKNEELNKKNKNYEIDIQKKLQQLATESNNNLVLEEKIKNLNNKIAEYESQIIEYKSGLIEREKDLTDNLNEKK